MWISVSSHKTPFMLRTRYDSNDGDNCRKSPLDCAMTDEGYNLCHFRYRITGRPKSNVERNLADRLNRRYQNNPESRQ